MDDKHVFIVIHPSRVSFYTRDSSGSDPVLPGELVETVLACLHSSFINRGYTVEIRDERSSSNEFTSRT